MLDQKRYLFIHSIRPDCPLTAVQLLVYSYLQFRAKKNHGARIARIVRFLGISRAAAYRAVRALLAFRAIHQQGKQYVSDPCDWSGKAYWRLYLPSSECPLTLAENMVLWKLADLFRWGRNQTSAKGLATMLPLTRNTIGKAMAKLEDMALIETMDGFKGRRNVLMEMSVVESNAIWWQDRKTVHQLEVPSKTPIAPPAVDEYITVLQQLTNYEEISQKELNKIMTRIKENQITVEELADLIDKANSQNDYSKYPHPAWYLLQLVRRERARQRGIAKQHETENLAWSIQRDEEKEAERAIAEAVKHTLAEPKELTRIVCRRYMHWEWNTAIYTARLDPVTIPGVKTRLSYQNEEGCWVNLESPRRWIECTEDRCGQEHCRTILQEFPLGGKANAAQFEHCCAAATD